MKLSPKTAHAHLPQVDPGRVYAGRPIGLRDGALLALLAAGFKPAEISAMRASDVTMAGGRVLATVLRDEVPIAITLPPDLGARLLAWITESRLWAAETHLFTSPRGPLNRKGVCKVFHRYCRRSSRTNQVQSRRNP
jgi:hypothetical protein